MNARGIVAYLLELNVLNADEVKRQLHLIGAYARHPQVKSWLNSVAFRYIINLEGDDAEREYSKYTVKRPKNGIHTDLPEPEKLPEWARRNIETKQAMHFFDPSQPRNRQLWRGVESIVEWFNSMPPDDPRVVRADRTGFQQALQLARAWHEEVAANPWHFMRDRPPVVKDFGDGMKFVQLVKLNHFKRESYRNSRDETPATSLGHCVGDGDNYIAQSQRGTHQYYSLRDAKNLPYVTLEVRADKDVLQIKGKRNGRPLPLAIPYILQFIKERGWHIVGDRANLTA